jgi:ubiquinone biosynthesis protein
MFVHSVAGIQRTVRHAHRYREIAAVLLKHGFEDLAVTRGLQRHPRFGWLRRALVDTDAPSRTRQERLRLAFEELGPAFVKLGQVLSTRHDILPEEFTAELEKFQDTVAPFPGTEARAIVEQEFGRPIHELLGRCARGAVAPNPRRPLAPPYYSRAA